MRPPNRTLFNPARAMQGLDAMQRVPMSTNQSYWVDKVTAYEEEQTMKFVVLGATGGIGSRRFARPSNTVIP
jgi:hypothetical protein